MHSVPPSRNILFVVLCLSRMTYWLPSNMIVATGIMQYWNVSQVAYSHPIRIIIPLRYLPSSPLRSVLLSSLVRPPASGINVHSKTGARRWTALARSYVCEVALADSGRICRAWIHVPCVFRALEPWSLGASEFLSKHRLTKSCTQPSIAKST
jgi:hypothetical protein